MLLDSEITIDKLVMKNCPGRLLDFFIITEIRHTDTLPSVKYLIVSPIHALQKRYSYNPEMLTTFNENIYRTICLKEL
jgi:hypothetical protein